MSLVLREHQAHVVDALREGFKQGHRSQLLYAPTGFGKTEVAIYLMKATADNYKRTAMVLDRIVLVDQTSLRLTKYGINHGVFQADHWKFDRIFLRLLQIFEINLLAFASSPMLPLN